MFVGLKDWIKTIQTSYLDDCYDSYLCIIVILCIFRRWIYYWKECNTYAPNRKTLGITKLVVLFFVWPLMLSWLVALSCVCLCVIVVVIGKFAWSIYKYLFEFSHSHNLQIFRESSSQIYTIQKLDRLNYLPIYLRFFVS